MVDVFGGHKQAIEYREINVNKMKLYFYKKNQMEKMIDENKKFIRKFKDVKIEGFELICNEFDSIFGKKVYINDNLLTFKHD